MLLLFFNKLFWLKSSKSFWSDENDHDTRVQVKTGFIKQLSHYHSQNNLVDSNLLLDFFFQMLNCPQNTLNMLPIQLFPIPSLECTLLTFNWLITATAVSNATIILFSEMLPDLTVSVTAGRGANWRANQQLSSEITCSESAKLGRPAFHYYPAFTAVNFSVITPPPAASLNTNLRPVYF